MDEKRSWCYMLACLRVRGPDVNTACHPYEIAANLFDGDDILARHVFGRTLSPALSWPSARSHPYDWHGCATVMLDEP
jgi:hypothetical protein